LFHGEEERGAESKSRRRRPITMANRSAKSVLKNNMEMEAAMELGLNADRSVKGHPKK
jgi:hypothetical protein